MIAPPEAGLGSAARLGSAAFWNEGRGASVDRKEIRGQSWSGDTGPLATAVTKRTQRLHGVWD